MGVEEADIVADGETRDGRAEFGDAADCFVADGDGYGGLDGEGAVEDHLGGFVSETGVGNMVVGSTRSEWQRPEEMVLTRISSSLGSGIGIVSSLIFILSGWNCAAFIVFAMIAVAVWLAQKMSMRKYSQLC